MFFAHQQTPAGQAEAGFGDEFEWDTDLLGGYSYEFLENKSRHPDVSRFFGCSTPEIFSRIRHGKFDSFLTMGWGLRCYWQAVSACRRYGVPVMVRGDSQLATPRSPFKRGLKEIIYPMMLKQFNACLFVGQRNREYLLHYGVAEDRLFHSPHCVDSHWFRDVSLHTDLLGIRESLGIEEQDKVLLFVGKLIQKKTPCRLDRSMCVDKRRSEIGNLFVRWIGTPKSRT